MESRVKHFLDNFTESELNVLSCALADYTERTKRLGLTLLHDKSKELEEDAERAYQLKKVW